jgi:hypothetical protein
MSFMLFKGRQSLDLILFTKSLIFPNESGSDSVVGDS